MGNGGDTITLSELIFRHIIILYHEALSRITPKFGLRGNVFKALWEKLKLVLFYFFPWLEPYFTSCHVFLLTLRPLSLLLDLW